MKSKLFILSVLFSASSMIAVAQQQGQHRQGNHQQMRVSPEQRVERMAKEISLTEAEKAKVLDLLKKEDVKADALREEMKKQKEAGQKLNAQQTTQMQELRRAHDNELEKIIGKEKFAQLQTIRNEKMQKMKNAAGKPGQRGQVNGKQQGQMRDKITPEMRANHLKTKLDLNDEQMQALTEVFKAQELKKDELKKEKMQEMMTANDAEIEKIIGKEKMEKLKADRSQQIDKVKENRKARK